MRVAVKMSVRGVRVAGNRGRGQQGGASRARVSRAAASRAPCSAGRRHSMCTESASARSRRVSRHLAVWCKTKCDLCLFFVTAKFTRAVLCDIYRFLYARIPVSIFFLVIRFGSYTSKNNILEHDLF